MTVLPRPAPPEQSRLAAADERNQQIDDFDARFEDFDGRRQAVEIRRRLVDRPPLFDRHFAEPVDRVAEHIEDAAERFIADRNGDPRTGVGHFNAARQTVGRTERDAADAVAAEVLLHFTDEFELPARFRLVVDGEGVVDLGKLAFVEFGVEGRADDLDHLADVLRIAVRVRHGIRSCLQGSLSASDHFKASTVPMISQIWLVICACRARL